MLDCYFVIASTFQRTDFSNLYFNRIFSGELSPNSTWHVLLYAARTQRISRKDVRCICDTVSVCTVIRIAVLDGVESLRDERGGCWMLRVQHCVELIRNSLRFLLLAVEVHCCNLECISVAGLCMLNYVIPRVTFGNFLFLYR